MPEVFAQIDTDFRRTGRVKHQIKLSDETTFKLRAGPTHSHRSYLWPCWRTYQHRGESWMWVSILLPITAVSKKNCQLCQEIKPLENKRFIHSQGWATPLSRSVVASGSVFSIYYQFEVNEPNETKTAFICPLGFSYFNWKPQRVTSYPPQWDGKEHEGIKVAVLNDFVVIARTLEEHNIKLTKVLSHIKE